MSWLTAITPSLPSSRALRSSCSSVGNSLTHGAHQLAHRLTSTGTPLEVGEADVAAVGIVERRRPARPCPCGCGRRPCSASAPAAGLALLALRAFAYRSRRPRAAARSSSDQPHGQLQSDVGRALCGRPGRGDARDKCLDRDRQAAVARGHRGQPRPCRDARRRRASSRPRTPPRSTAGSPQIAEEYRSRQARRGSGARRHPHACRASAGRADRPGRRPAPHRPLAQRPGRDRFQVVRAPRDRRGDRAASTRSKSRCSTAPRSMRRRSCPASPICSRASR